MRKNVAGQAVGCQMMTIADGAPFTGTVTIYITGDNGTQTIGSVGSGVCTHEGRGYHSYAPAQAESNFDHIAFTFDGGATAATATVQVYTTFPQTGDNFARLGAPAGASVSADVASVKTSVGAVTGAVGSVTGAVGSVASGGITAASLAADTITAAKVAADVTTEIQAGLATAAALTTAQADLDDIQTRLPAALVSGRMDASVGAMAASVMTAAAAAADLTTELQTGLATAAALATAQTDLDAIDAKTTNLPTDPADQSLIIAATDALSTLIGQRATPAQVNAEVVDALNVDTYAEPGQEAPPATASIVKKLGWLYKTFRNKKTQSATALSIFADDAATVDAKATISDDATTYTHGEITSGP